MATSTNTAKRRSALDELCEYFGKNCSMTGAEYRRTVQTRVFATVTNEKNRNGNWEAVSHPIADDDLLAVLQAAKRFGIEPLNREIYPYRSRDGRIVPTLSVDGWLHFVNAQPDYDGFEATFADEEVEVPGSKLKCAAWCEVRLFRKSLTHPIVVREYTEEVIRAVTGRDGRFVQTPWQQWPRRMLRHRTFVQAARYAFPCAGLGIVGADGMVEDEREGREVYLGDLAPEYTDGIKEGAPAASIAPVPPGLSQDEVRAHEDDMQTHAETVCASPASVRHGGSEEAGTAETAPVQSDIPPARPEEAAKQPVSELYNLGNEAAFKDYLHRMFRMGQTKRRPKSAVAQWIVSNWRGKDQLFAVGQWNAFCEANAV